MSIPSKLRVCVLLAPQGAAARGMSVDLDTMADIFDSFVAEGGHFPELDLH